MQKEVIGNATLYCGDCMELMEGMKENEFNLAIVDPEFGIGIGTSPRLVTDKGWKPKSWDDKPIDDSYFVGIFRVAKNAIIWGGNYYHLQGNKHCVIWDKMQPESLSFGMFDYAWTSFNGANKIFRMSVQDERGKIHPTQKPVRLYEWLLKNYAQPGQTIFDSHLGSGSSAIACNNLGFKFTGIEIDQEYFDAACKRIEDAQKQLNLFDLPEAREVEQLSLL